MSELKPCPFCGGEAEINGESKTGTWVVYCIGDNCTTEPATAICFSKAEAIAAWNTRAERTCRNIKDHYREATGNIGETSFMCSQCGAHYCDAENYYAYLSTGRTNYCPNCGARVVER